MKELTGVEVLWLDTYHDGPIAGVALYEGKERYFKAVFDEERDEWTNPRHFLLYPMDRSAIQEAWEKHRFFEEKVSTTSCYHEGRDEPVVRAQELHHEFYEKYPPGPVPVGDPVGWFSLPLESFRPSLR